MLLWIGFIISVILNGVAGYGIMKALRHVEEYDDFFEETQNRIRKIIQTMKEIDIRGSFESDDEVGGVFEQMHALVQSLDVFLLEEVNEEETAQKK